MLCCYCQLTEFGIQIIKAFISEVLELSLQASQRCICNTPTGIKRWPLMRNYERQAENGRL